MTELIKHPAVARVQAALAAGGSAARVIVLSDSARTAQQAADALGCPVGAIVKSLVFAYGGRPYMALVAGDRRCDTRALAVYFGISGEMERATPELVRAATGFAIGGVAPLGHLQQIPMALDESLRRFERLFAAAGHPHAVFETNLQELAYLTGAKMAPLGAA